MRVRLIAGEFGGRFIAAPDNTSTHPMGERIRGGLFNILGDISGLTVLDAFAGTGSLGFEALSRGAESVTFVERDRIAQKVLVENIETLKVKNKTKVIAASLSGWIETAGDRQFDLIFADPPYHEMQLSTISRLFPYLKTKGLMILSHPGRESAPTVNGVVVVDNRSYGDAALAFYRLDSNGKEKQ